MTPPRVWWSRPDAGQRATQKGGSRRSPRGRSCRATPQCLAIGEDALMEMQASRRKRELSMCVINRYVDAATKLVNKDRLPGPVGPDPRIAANCRRHRASTRARHRSRAQTLLDSACSRAPPDPLVRSRPAAAAAATRESVEVGLWAFSAMPRPAHRLPFASQLPTYPCWAGNGAAAARGRGEEEAASLRRRRERKGAGETSLGHATRRPGKACPPARPQNALPATTHTPSPLVIRRASPGVVDGGAVCGMRECCCWRRKRRRDGEGDPSLSAVRVMKLLSSPVHIRRRGALPPPLHHGSCLALPILSIGIHTPSYCSSSSCAWESPTHRYYTSHLHQSSTVSQSNDLLDVALIMSEPQNQKAAEPSSTGTRRRVSPLLPSPSRPLIVVATPGVTPPSG